MKKTKLKAIFSLLTSVFFILCFDISTPAQSSVQECFLPEPGGQYKVGTINIFLEDSSRTEPFFTRKKQIRRLYLKIWYPADSIGDTTPTVYLPGYDLGVLKRNYSWMDATRSYFRNISDAPTHSFRGIPSSDGEEKYPVVLFSHGFGIGLCEFYHSIMENLASHGYVIIAIVHPYESVIINYPDGHTTKGRNLVNLFHFDLKNTKFRKTAKTVTTEAERIALIKESQQNAKFISSVNARWTEDTRFVLDWIVKNSESDSLQTLKGKLDTGKVAAMGHSFGGSATGSICSLDKRIKVGINLDGWQFGDQFNRGLLCPMLFIGAEASDWYDLFYLNTKEDYYSVIIPGSKHFTFTDLSVLPDVPDETKIKYLSFVDSYPNLKMTNDLILNFLGHYLEGKPLSPVFVNQRAR